MTKQKKDKKQNNNGLTTTLYKIPKWVKDVDDMSEFLGIDGFKFNILKSLFSARGARHAGTNQFRDNNKILHYGIRNVLTEARKLKKHTTVSDILLTVYDKLSKKERKKFKKLINNT